MRRGEIMADTATSVRDARASLPELEDAPSTAGAALDLLLTEAGLGTRTRSYRAGRPSG
jgi:hypothetical protein